MSKEQLIKDIANLFLKNEFVKDYYNSKYSNDSSKVLEKYKFIIENEFFPKNGFGEARLPVTKKAITEFKKISVDKMQIA